MSQVLRPSATFWGIMAEKAGFEPALRSLVNTLSKRAPSATRPPLRKVQCSIIAEIVKVKKLLIQLQSLRLHW